VRPLVLAMVMATLGAGCAIDPIDIANRQCDVDHPCAAEYTCIDEICERTDSLDDGE